MKKPNFLSLIWLYLFFISLPLISFSQNEANIWYFGANAGIDFNSGTAMALSNGALSTNEGCTSVSDNTGSLLFYTDGITVWNKNHTAMPNGTGLLGDFSSTQSVIIVKLPGATNIYYVFTVDNEAGPNGLRYSEVDMSQQGGLGEVTSNKNILITTPTCEKVAAIRHQNQQAFWIVTKLANSNTFHSYLLSNTGLNMTPVVSNAGSVSNTLLSTVGYLKASSNGSQIVSVNWDTDSVDVMDFDNSNGTISNSITLTNFSENRPYGAEFSPDGNLLYISEVFSVANTNNIYQYNLQAGNQTAIEASRITIAAINIPCGALQLASDQKIYLTHFGVDSLTTINHPNILGSGCNFSLLSFPLAANTTARFGLPTFTNDAFVRPRFSVENVCFSSSTFFSLDTVNYQHDSVLWNFGDPVTGVNDTSTNFSPTHIFSAADTFDITLISYWNNDTDTTIQQVIITPFPVFSLGADTTLCTGDSLLLDAISNNSTYLWQDSTTSSTFTVVNSGIYWVEATLGECSVRDSIEVLYNSLPLINLGSDTITCPDNTVTLNAFGGVNYIWSTGETTQSISFIPISDTTISVTGFDTNGCANVDTVMITIAPEPVADAGMDQTICEGDTASLIASGGSMYLWDTGDDTSHIEVFPTDTTAYEVIVTDSSGCTDKDTVLVYVDPLPVASAGANTIGNFEVQLFNYSINADSVFWEFGDGFSDTTENPIHVYMFTGVFEVTLYAFNDCGVDTLSFFPIAISIENDIASPEISVYPNPVQEFLHIDFKEMGIKPLEINIINAKGQMIRQDAIAHHNSEFSKTINLQDLPTGIYFLIVRNEDVSVVEKFILQNDD